METARVVLGLAKLLQSALVHAEDTSSGGLIIYIHPASEQAHLVDAVGYDLPHPVRAASAVGTGGAAPCLCRALPPLVVWIPAAESTHAFSHGLRTQTRFLRGWGASVSVSMQSMRLGCWSCQPASEVELDPSKPCAIITDFTRDDVSLFAPTGEIQAPLLLVIPIAPDGLMTGLDRGTPGMSLDSGSALAARVRQSLRLGASPLLCTVVSEWAIGWQATGLQLPLVNTVIVTCIVHVSLAPRPTARSLLTTLRDASFESDLTAAVLRAHSSLDGLRSPCDDDTVPRVDVRGLKLASAADALARALHGGSSALLRATAAAAGLQPASSQATAAMLSVQLLEIVKPRSSA
jgi:hypothetical protein